MQIPEQFVADTVAREGAAGREWLEALDGRVATLLERWGLVPDGPVMHGYLGVVLPVLRQSEPCALKVSWVDRYNEHEIDALSAWDGRGAVELMAHDREQGALLLERLDSSRNLTALQPNHAAEVAGHLLRRLAIPAPAWTEPLTVEATLLRESLPSDWEDYGRPFSRSVLDRALGLLDSLASEGANLLVNSDLHYENVLAGEREPWLAIDPKVLGGALEYGVAQLLWQPFAAILSRHDLQQRLMTVARAADLNPDLARAWTFVRIIDYWIWALEVGFTEDPQRCEQLIAWL